MILIRGKNKLPGAAGGKGGDGMSLPTFDETADSLRMVCDEAQKGLYQLGQIRGRNDLQSEKELRIFILATSKVILETLPCLQLEENTIEEMDRKYSHILNEFMEKSETV